MRDEKLYPRVIGIEDSELRIGLLPGVFKGARGSTPDHYQVAEDGDFAKAQGSTVEMKSFAVECRDVNATEGHRLLIVSPNAPKGVAAGLVVGTNYRTCRPGACGCRARSTPRLHASMRMSLGPG